MQEALNEAQELQKKAIREAEEQLRKEEEAEQEKYIQILFIFIEFEILNFPLKLSFVKVETV